MRCAPAVAQEARALRIPIDAHCAHLLVRGTLHAQGCGHGDVSEAEAAAMEARESDIVRAPGYADPHRRR